MEVQGITKDRQQASKAVRAAEHRNWRRDFALAMAVIAATVAAATGLADIVRRAGVQF
jgi:hypothetical protein